MLLRSAMMKMASTGGPTRSTIESMVVLVGDDSLKTISW